MAESYNFSSFKLLLLDDNPFVRSLVRKLCRSFGFAEIQEAESVDQAMTLLDNRQLTGQFDLAIVDWEMEPHDGTVFVKRVRGSADDGPLRYLPIIMLTAHTSAARITQARDLGVHEFLAKPVSAKTLLARICSIVDTPRPFIQTPTYFGPDRRRKKDPNYKGPERRTAPADDGTVAAPPVTVPSPAAA